MSLLLVVTHLQDSDEPPLTGGPAKEFLRVHVVVLRALVEAIALDDVLKLAPTAAGESLVEVVPDLDDSASGSGLEELECIFLGNLGDDGDEARPAEGGSVCGGGVRGGHGMILCLLPELRNPSKEVLSTKG